MGNCQTNQINEGETYLQPPPLQYQQQLQLQLQQQEEQVQDNHQEKVQKIVEQQKKAYLQKQSSLLKFRNSNNIQRKNSYLQTPQNTSRLQKKSISFISSADTDFTVNSYQQQHTNESSDNENTHLNLGSLPNNNNMSVLSASSDRNIRLTRRSSTYTLKTRNSTNLIEQQQDIQKQQYNQQKLMEKSYTSVSPPTSSKKQQQQGKYINVQQQLDVYKNQDLLQQQKEQFKRSIQKQKTQILEEIAEEIPNNSEISVEYIKARNEFKAQFGYTETPAPVLDQNFGNSFLVKRRTAYLKKIEELQISEEIC